MKTTPPVVIAVLALLALSVVKAEPPQSKLLEDGKYFLTSIIDPMEGRAETFPSCTSATIKINKEGVPILQIQDPRFNPEQNDIEILLTENGLQFIVSRKKEGFVTVYSASTILSRIEGHFYCINGGGGMSFKGRFALEKQK